MSCAGAATAGQLLNRHFLGYNWEMAQYPWKRFWCSRDQSFVVDDDGYVFDPDSEHGHIVNPSLSALKDLIKYPCLVLLGEPGMGKSTEFDLEFDRVKSTCATPEVAVRIDLKEYQTDHRLIDDAFKCEHVREWIDADHNLWLFFDSLDEGRLEIRNIAQILRSQLQKLRESAERLHVRIACRTAEWPASLEDGLRSIWGEDQVGVFQLVPLRKHDIHEAAKVEGVDPTTFIAEVADNRIESLAMNPITLRFLLHSFQHSNSFPTSRFQLFEEGCQRLCEESSQSRREAGHVGQVSSTQRLEIATRIAGISIFSGRPLIEAAIQIEAHDGDVITLAEMAGRTERVNGEEFTVSEGSIREVLATTLFTGFGSGRLGFSHRTYAEFLAARYVCQRGLDDTQVSGLIFHDEAAQKVVPQLAETAAWIAGNNEQVFERIICDDPQVVLRSDVATVEMKSELVAHLVDGMRSGEIDDSDRGLRNHYVKLAHDELAKQLEPIIQDKSLNVVTRRFAIDVAEACAERRLLPVLVDVALDEADLAHIRSQASYAILRIGDEEYCRSLIPLALGQGGSDPDDELRGCALRVVWPRGFINAAQLFASLIQPKQRNLLGAYRFFLKQELIPSLKVEELAEGLRWASQIAPVHGRTDEFAKLIEGIVRRSIDHLHEQGVFDAFSDYVTSRVLSGREFELNDSIFSTMPADVRRRLMAAIIPKCTALEGAYAVLGVHLGLVQTGDVAWLLNQASAAGSEDAKRMWAGIARIRFIYSDKSEQRAVLAYRETDSVIAQVFSDLFDAVSIDSDRAQEMRRAYEQSMELERLHNERLQPQLIDPPPAEQISDCLDQIETGNVGAWRTLVGLLELKEHDEIDLPSLSDNITEFPGWVSASEPTRQRILSAARAFVEEFEPGQGRVDMARFCIADLAVSSNLLLALLDDLLRQMYQKWASLVPCFELSGSELTKWRRRQ